MIIIVIIVLNYGFPIGHGFGSRKLSGGRTDRRAKVAKNYSATAAVLFIDYNDDNLIVIIRDLPIQSDPRVVVAVVVLNYNTVQYKAGGGEPVTRTRTII